MPKRRADSAMMRPSRGRRRQWLKLLDMSPEIRNFIAENNAHLKTKE